MRVSTLWAKFKTLLLTVLAIVAVLGLVVGDYFLRHEVTGQARRELKSSGFQLGATGIIKAIELNQLSKFETFETAKISFAETDESGMTPINFAIEEQNNAAINKLLMRKRTLKPTIDKPCKDGITPLNRALRRRDFKLADELVKLGANINHEKTPGMPWLIEAINQKDTKLRDYLLVNKINVNDRGDQPFPAIALAARDDNLDLMKRLKTKGSNLKVKGTTGNTLLIEAILENDRNEIDFLLNQKLSPNDRGAYQYPPLAIAAKNNDVQLMKRLISAGGDINIKGTSGKELFLESLLENSYKEIELLLKSGADPNRKIGKHDPLLMALKREDGYLRSLLVENGAKLNRNGLNGRPLVFEALDKKDHDWMMQLIDSGVSPNKKSPKGETLLLNAIADRDYQMVECLIAKKADINQKGKKGITPIQLAVSNGDLAITRTLVQKRVDINWGQMAEIAYKNRDNPTLNLLLNAGMSPEIKLPSANKRLFDVAMADGTIETAKILLKSDVGLGNNFWRALKNNMDEVAVLCLQAGHDPIKAGPDGKSPLRYVLDEQKYSMIEPLLNAGAHEAPALHAQESWLGRLIRNGDSELALGLMSVTENFGDARAGDGHSLLAWSIANGMESVSLALIARDVDVNVTEPAPASKALTAKFGDSTRFQSYLKYDSKLRPLMMVAVKRNYRVAQAMIKAGAKNTPSQKFNYPVSIAAWFHDNRMMQIFFGRNPDYQPRKLIVNLSSQKLTYYVNNQPIYSSSVSTGKPGFETKTGSFVITQKNKDHVSNLYDAEMPYFMRLSCGDFGFHTGIIPGYPASHGCIRLPDETAKKMFYECALGDLVIIHN